MKFTHAKGFVCCPGRNFVTLKIETDEGLAGIGDATLNGRERAVGEIFNTIWDCKALIDYNSATDLRWVTRASSARPSLRRVTTIIRQRPRGRLPAPRPAG